MKVIWLYQQSYIFHNWLDMGHDTYMYSCKDFQSRDGYINLWCDARKLCFSATFYNVKDQGFNHRTPTSLFPFPSKTSSPIQYTWCMHIKGTNFFTCKIYPIPRYCFVMSKTKLWSENLTQTLRHNIFINRHEIHFHGLMTSIQFMI